MEWNAELQVVDRTDTFSAALRREEGSDGESAVGAAAAGLTVHWINRTAAPDEYGLRASVVELENLTALAPRLSAPHT